jgi:hypothetical protein
VRRCGKIAKSYQVGQGYWKSFTAAHLLRQAEGIESLNDVARIRRFFTLALSSDPQL